MLMISPSMSWLASPLQGGIQGYAYPLGKNVNLDIALSNQFQALSFGSILLVIGGLALLLSMIQSYKNTLFFLGGLAIILCLGFISNMLFLQPEILDSLANQNTQVQQIKNFSMQFPYANAIQLESLNNSDSNTLSGKTEIILYHLGIGWYLALAGALIILLIVKDQHGNPVKTTVAYLILISLIMMISLSSKTLLAEYELSQGDYYLAQGDLEQAMSFYRSAIIWNTKLNHNANTAYKVGATCYRLGWHHCPETHLYLGDSLMEVDAIAKAIHEYERVLVSEDNTLLVNSKLVKAYTKMGLRQYSNGKKYAAISNWQQALRLDPNQIQINLFLAKSYAEINGHDQSQTLTEAQKLLEKTDNKLLRADVYNLLGDAYYKQNDLTTARSMYRQSREQYKLVKKIINFGAMQGLQGI